MKSRIFKGSGVALVTPFNRKNEVDFDELEKLINLHLEKSTDAIIVCGTTGEASTLSFTEKLRIIDCAVHTVNHAIPVIAGTGSNDTELSIHLTRKAEFLGVDGTLQVTPYYNKTTQKGLIKHFKAISENSKLPIILYNVPSRTGLNIEVSTLKELSKDPKIVAIKEASGNIVYFAKAMAECGKDLDFYSGDDHTIVSMMALGAIGVISVLANILPLEVHNICEACFNMDYTTASTLQLQYIDLISALFSETNPIPIKEACKLMRLNVGNCRLPLCEMSEQNLIMLKRVLWTHNLIF